MIRETSRLFSIHQVSVSSSSSSAVTCVDLSQFVFQTRLSTSIIHWNKYTGKAFQPNRLRTVFCSLEKDWRGFTASVFCCPTKTCLTTLIFKSLYHNKHRHCDHNNGYIIVILRFNQKIRYCSEVIISWKSKADESWFMKHRIRMLYTRGRWLFCLFALFFLGLTKPITQKNPGSLSRWACNGPTHMPEWVAVLRYTVSPIGKVEGH